jgi:cytochrome c-type biogenesis protein CcmH/NrfF
MDYELLADLPIQRKRDANTEMDVMERIIISQGSVTVLTPGTISFTVMLCVVSLVVLLAIVFGITCMAVRRRRQTMKALTESSNFSFHQ